MAEKVVWMSVNRMYAETSDIDKQNTLISVKTSEGETMKEMSVKVFQAVGLPETGLILQLRNKQGSLILLNGRLKENTSDTPYALSILTEYQRVMPKPRSVQSETYSSTIHNQTQIFLSRISNLENSIPELNVKREEKIKQEICELEDKLNFLQKRFSEADQTEWTGIIKKSPLW